ncbi:MAG: DUF5004 domain-containing protein [Crocinitomicaceae bacterium]|jgi:hypothetical protein|nr:DUF5004 domain-containing protein [Crocinitomicaceae bacterium]
MKLLFRASTVAFLALTMVIVSSCSKYEEGSKFTLLTAKARVTGDWTTTAITVNGTSQDLTGTSFTTSIKKDGTYTASSSYTFGGSTFTTNENGTWEFNSDKTELINTDSDGDVSTATITMLKNKMMKLKTVDGSFTTIVTLEQ